MIGRVPIQPVDRGSRDELLDIDDAGAFQLHLLEVLPLEQDVLVLRNLKALDQVAARNLFPSAGVHSLHPDAVAGLRIDQVEADGLGLGGGRIQGDRTGHQAQAQVAFP
jgi:hypothetical protein